MSCGRVEKHVGDSLSGDKLLEKHFGLHVRLLEVHSKQQLIGHERHQPVIGDTERRDAAGQRQIHFGLLENFSLIAFPYFHVARRDDESFLRSTGGSILLHQRTVVELVEVESHFQEKQI